MSESKTKESARDWLYTRFPNMKMMDMNWTARKYDYPEYVCQYIKDNWKKVNDNNGGTYEKPSIEKEKTFGTQYKNTQSYKEMDKTNKAATDIMASKGMEEAVKHMFKDNNTGKQLSYSEMRMRYG